MNYQPIPAKEEYSNIISQINTYVADLSNWDGERPNSNITINKYNNITYAGVHHLRSNSDPLIHKIEKIFSEHSTKQNPIVLIEDWEIVNYLTKDDALDAKGERGLLMFLGQVSTIKIVPIDYERKDIYSFLCGHYSIDDINLFLFLYQVKSKFLTKDLTLKKFKTEVMTKLNTSFTWAGIPTINITYEYLDNLYTKQFGNSIYSERTISPFDYLNPIKSKNIYTEIFMKYHSIRDSNFLYQICVHALEGYDVLVVLGQDHALFGHTFLQKCSLIK